MVPFPRGQSCIGEVKCVVVVIDVHDPIAVLEERKFDDLTLGIKDFDRLKEVWPHPETDRQRG